MLDSKANLAKQNADAVMARSSNVFVADKLSDNNKLQLDDWNVNWVELRSKQGFRKFEVILKQLQVSHRGLSENVKLDEVVDSVINSLIG